MSYLYGDSTPFPLDENFLETARATTEACVTLLHADAMASEGRRAIREAEVRATQETTRINALARRLDDTFDTPFTRGEAVPPVDDLTGRIGMLTRTMVEQARTEIQRWRDAAVTAVNAAAPQALVIPALSELLVRHQLPGTTWSLRWRAGLGGAATEAEVYALHGSGLEAALAVEVPPTHPFHRPLRVATLEKRVTIHLTRARWFGDPRPAPERLDRLYVTEVTHVPDQASMMLRESAKEPSPGVEILLRSATSTEVIATRIGSDGVRVGRSEVLGPEDRAVVERLWAKVEAGICDLVCHRRSLKAVMLRGVPAAEVVHPQALAEVLIEAVAPLVREMAARTSTPGELALKRHTGDGRREELFVPYEAVMGTTAGLSEAHRALFGVYGLDARPDRDSHTRRTGGVVHQLLPPAPRAPHLRVVVNG